MSAMLKLRRASSITPVATIASKAGAFSRVRASPCRDELKPIPLTQLLEAFPMRFAQGWRRYVVVAVAATVRKSIRSVLGVDLLRS